MKAGIGIDVGSLYFKAVIIDDGGKTIETFYQKHHGSPWKTMAEWLDSVKLECRVTIGISGADDCHFSSIQHLQHIDGPRCLLEGAKHQVGIVNSIIDIGGSTLSLIELNCNGEFESYSTNSLCAAGTGSFLDEQAKRLSINYDEIKNYPFISSPPTIASRCAVFAKSDLIHRQQEGYSKGQMWSGLCQGLSHTILQTLFKGRPVQGKIIIAGGVSQNLEVYRWIKTLAPEAEVICPSNGHLLQALGAGLIALRTGGVSCELAKFKDSIRPLLLQLETSRNLNYMKLTEEPLELKLSKYPSFEVAEFYMEEDNTEVRIHKWTERGNTVKAYLGIDIGSTSTKAVLMNENDEVLVDIYRKTLADPIGAVRRILNSLTKIQEEKTTPIEILGCATTGSGRKMIGMIIGADLIVNEITAHVMGALKVDPEVETIFEIGGQDSKFIRVSNGQVVDSNMNYICAAGTGSFIEEQANKLGFKVSQIGELAVGVTPPATSDRCTVFMEQDLNNLISSGYSPIQALAGIMRSIVKNYLNKVVGKRKFSTKAISFMGATARNKGLVAAFEKHLNAPITVSPYCHVMGAYGCAVGVKEKMLNEKIAKSTFKGLDILNRKVEIKKEDCQLCSNHCRITSVKIEGEQQSPSWGYLCGREPDEKKMKRRDEFEPFRIREKLFRQIGKVPLSPDAPSIAIPSVLTFHSFMPLWRSFFGHLGFRVVSSGKTTEEIKGKCLELVNADFCFPVKVTFGHVWKLINDESIRFVFLPHVISNKINPYTTDSQFCPWVQGCPSSVKTALRQQGISLEKIISPIVDFRLTPQKAAKKIYNALGKKLGVTKNHLIYAWEKALESQREFESRCVEEGRKILKKIKEENKRAIVIVGRPYNVVDTGINVELPEKIANYGYTVIPMDFLPFRPELLGQRFRNMYWNYGQRILSVLKQVADNENLNGVYLSNFSCGPDSFIISYAEEVMKDKPMLILELDEHGADAGYITRIEAFLDVVRNQKKQNRTEPFEHFSPPTDWERRRLWIPPMSEIGSQLFAAAFRAYGFNAQPLPVENISTFELGRKLTRGSECLPTAATLGVFIDTLKKTGADPSKEALFMPTAEGPCRFGQYATCHRIALEKMGYGEVAILSPSSFNCYMGLPSGLRRYIWEIILIQDLLTKIVCKLRPYEAEKSSVDEMLKAQLKALLRAVEQNSPLVDAFQHAVENFKTIEIKKTYKPLVGIVGEIYVRCNPFCNGDVIRAIERYGGEAWLSPISEWILYTSEVSRRAVSNGTTLNMFSSPIERVKVWMKDGFLHSMEKKYYDAAGDLLADRREPDIREIIEAGESYIPIEFEGETILTIGRAIKFIEQGASMVVSANPFGCMPGTLSSACLMEVQRQTGVPIINLFYDGEASINRILSSFIGNISYKARTASPPLTQHYHYAGK